MQKILLVEDDIQVSSLVKTMLELEGWPVVHADTGREAIKTAGTWNPGIILLDLGLPDMDGLEVIQTIRGWSNVPILILSARNEDKDKIDALDLGADDYLSKPFSVEELLARLRATERRLSYNTKQEVQNRFTNGDLTIDFEGQEVQRNGEPLHLTPIEYKLLELLSRNCGKVLTSSWLTKQVWGSALESDLVSLRVHMAGLRKKIGSEKIQTRIGTGYKMVRL